MIKSKRLGAIKFQIAEGGLESGPLRCGPHDSDAYLYSRHKIPLTYGREFLPIERTQRLDRIFLRTARHQMSAVSERFGIVDQSEKSRVKTTLAWRRPSKNSVPHFIQF